MGPVIDANSKARIEGLIGKGGQEGTEIIVDGRNQKVNGYEDGYWVFPTVLDKVAPEGEIAQTEIFGPVLSVMRASTVDEAIQLVNHRAFGNMACIFTSSGATARQFRYEADAGNVGINIGVAAPMAYFPFSGVVSVDGDAECQFLRRLARRPGDSHCATPHALVGADFASKFGASVARQVTVTSVASQLRRNGNLI